MIRAAWKAGARAGGVALAVWAAVTGGAWAQGEPAIIKRPTELREAPGESGRVLAALPAQSQVQRLAERQGPWVRVSTGSGPTGWVHMFDLGPLSGSASNTANGSGAGALRGVTSLFTTRGISATTATSNLGIRGLGAEDLARAQPNLPAVGQMEGLRQSEDQARRFAQASSLAAVQVPELPATPKPGAAPAGAANPGRPETAP